MNDSSQRGKRVVVYRVGSLGDTLIVLPAFHLVRQAFPGAHITLLTSFPVNAKAAPMETILQNTGLYDDTLRYPTSLRDIRELSRLRRELRVGRYDALVYLAKPKGGILTSIRDWFFFRSCGIRKLIGIPFRRRTLECLEIPGSDRFTSETVRTLDAIRGLGAADVRESRWWDMRLTDAEKSDAEKLLAAHGVAAPFLAASVGTKIPAKDWEERNWAELIHRLAAENPRLPLVLFGVREEHERSERLAALWTGPKANLCGAASPRVSAAALRGAAAMVCHDSGPMHLAATMGVPCAAIFSARARPGEWYPRGEGHAIFYHRTPCWGCGLNDCIERKKACILSITVDEVFTAVQQMLALPRPGQTS
jgi:ADP-heptose:LPS heptosyltransferase